jgi:uncharacterized membrane protein
MTQTLKIAGWLVMTASAVFLFYTTTEYLSFRSDIHFLLAKTEVVFDMGWRSAFYIHIISAMIVLIIGPFQFVKKLRNKYLNTHRSMGKIYAYGIVLLAGPSGFFMAFYAEGGLWSTIAFLIMSLLWIWTTIMAVYFARKKKIIDHKKWMIRSMALTFAAVSLRLLVPLFSAGLGLEENFVIVSTAWLSWIINLAIAETLILTTFPNNLTKELAV